MIKTLIFDPGVLINESRAHRASDRIQNQDRASFVHILLSSDLAANRRDTPKGRRRKTRSGRHPDCVFSNRRRS